jgi:hypothetical protein
MAYKKADKTVPFNLRIDVRLIAEIKTICADQYSFFENPTQLIRYCIKQQLPLIKRELEETNRGEK